MIRLFLLALVAGLAGCGGSQTADLWIAEEVNVGFVALPEDRVSLPVENRGRGVGRVVGLEEGCYDPFCVRPGPDVPTVIPPGQTVGIGVDLAVRKPGPFRQAITVHFDDGRLRTVTVVLIGVGIAAPN